MCEFREVDFGNCDLTGVDFNRSNLRDANLSQRILFRVVEYTSCYDRISYIITPYVFLRARLLYRAKKCVFLTELRGLTAWVCVYIHCGGGYDFLTVYKINVI